MPKDSHASRKAGAARTVVLGILIVAVIALFILGKRQNEPGPANPQSPESAVARESKTERSPESPAKTRREQILKAANNPEELVALLDGLIELGLDEDPEITRLYQYAKFSPEQAAQIVNKYRSSHIAANVYSFYVQAAGDRGDRDAIKRFASLIEDAFSRGEALSRAATHTELFAAGVINTAIEGLPDRDKQSVGEGIAEKMINRLQGEERMKAVDAYYAATSDPAVLSPLAGAVTATLVKDKPEEAIAWSLDNTPAAVEGGDRNLLLGLGAGKADLAMGFAAKLLERQEYARASHVYEIISRHCYLGRQTAVIEWAAALPGDITSKRSILLQNFSELYDKGKGDVRGNWPPASMTPP